MTIRRTALAMAFLMAAGPVRAEQLPTVPVEHQETVARAAVALAFAHGCATIVNAPFLVRDGLRLLEAAYSTAGFSDPVDLAHNAYWNVISLIQEGQFGVNSTFDVSACQIIEKEIATAANAID